MLETISALSSVIGGGIAVSVAARFSVEHGFMTLLLERYRTPKNKLCSGIQFPYLEKLVGERIPCEMLCKNVLFRIEMMTKRRLVKLQAISPLHTLLPSHSWH